MKILAPSDLCDLPVRKTLRNRPSDGNAWWLALTHELPVECLVPISVLLDLERRHGGRDVDLIIARDQGADGPMVYGELVVWLEPKEAM